MSNQKWKVIGVIGTSAALLMFALVTQKIAASNDDRDAVKAVIQDRMNVLQGFGASTDGKLAASDLLSTKAVAHDELARIYAGDLLATRERQMDASLEAQSAGQVLLFAGGTSSLDFDSIQIAGDSATAVVRATTWSLVGQSIGGKVATARPENTETFTFNLMRGTEGWRVEGESFQFEPGSEP